MRHSGRTFTGDFQFRYRAYARDHGMTPDQMLAHDKRCHPCTLLTPYLFWISLKWLEWGQLRPGRVIRSTEEAANFETWLEELVPDSDALTCQCHAVTQVVLPARCSSVR
jgi:hypothetical protein